MGTKYGSIAIQKFLSHLFHSLNNRQILIYCDDILLMSKNCEDLMQYLTQILETLRQANLTLKGDKCVFACEETQYLGFVVSNDGLKFSKSKIDPILNFPYGDTKRK